MPDAPTLEIADTGRLRRMFDDARFLTADDRREAQTDRDYYDGWNQLTSAERAVLRNRGQPEIIINRVRRAVDGTLGVVIQNKSDPRAYPREPNAQDAADVASDALRYAADTNHFDQIKIDCLENGLVEGTYAVIVEGAPDEDVTITQIRSEEFFYDPRSRRADFADARYLGVGKWMDLDQLPRKSDGSAVATQEDMGTDTGWMADDTWQDRPDAISGSTWIDRGKKRLMVVELYYQDGVKWMRAVFCAAAVIEHGESAYVDQDRRSACPIIAGSSYVGRENQRYGVVRDMRGPQDEINMRRSKLLHMVNVRQVQPISMDAPPVDVETVRREAARPDGVIPMGWQTVPVTDMTSGQSALLAEAKNEIERMSPNPALIGRGGDDASGRSVQLRQQAGLTELARVLGRFNDWELRVYKATWRCMRQFWTAPKWIRVTGDEGAPKFVQVNVPTSAGVPQVDPQTRRPVTGGDGQPVWATPPKMDNHIAEMDVDIVLDTVPDTANLEQEVWQELNRLLASNPAYAQAIPFSMAVKLSPLPKKREIVQILQELEQQAKSLQAAAQAHQAEMAQAQSQSQVRERDARTASGLADARHTDILATVEALHGHVAADQASALAGGVMPAPVAADTGGAGPTPVNGS